MRRICFRKSLDPALTGTPALSVHALQKLQPSKRGKAEHPILLSVPVHFSLDDWEQGTQVAFERMHALGFYVLQQPLAAVYSHGLVTGVAVDLGHETIGSLLPSPQQKEAMPWFSLRRLLLQLQFDRYHAGSGQHSDNRGSSDHQHWRQRH